MPQERPEKFPVGPKIFELHVDDSPQARFQIGLSSEGDLDLVLVTDDPAEAAQAIITAYRSLGKTAGEQYDERRRSTDIERSGA